MDRSLLGLLSARNPASPFAMSSHSRDISRSPSLTPTRSQLCFSWCLTCCLPGEQLSLLFRGEGEFTVHFLRYAARPCLSKTSPLSTKIFRCPPRPHFPPPYRQHGLPPTAEPLVAEPQSPIAACHCWTRTTVLTSVLRISRLVPPTSPLALRNYPDSHEATGLPLARHVLLQRRVVEHTRSRPPAVMGAAPTALALRYRPHGIQRRRCSDSHGCRHKLHGQQRGRQCLCLAV